MIKFSVSNLATYRGNVNVEMKIDKENKPPLYDDGNLMLSTTTNNQVLTWIKLRHNILS